MGSGIVYMIKNEANGKRYVGRTFAPLWHRLKKHMYLLGAGRHTNKGLQSDFNSYGARVFHIMAIENVPYGDPEMRERHWMWKLKTYDSRFGYNDLDPAAKKLRKRMGLPVIRNRSQVKEE